MVICFVAANLPSVKDKISFDTINTQKEAIIELANGTWGPFIFIGATVLFILVQLPGMIMVVVAGLVYNFWEAFFYSLAGTLIGTTLSFLIARFFLRDYFRPKLERSTLRGQLEFIEKNGFVAVFFLRFILVIAPPLNWLLGSTNIKTRDYVVGTFAALIPIIGAMLLAVKRLKTIRSKSDLLQPEVIGIIVGFLLLFAVIHIVRYRMKKANEKR